MEWRRWNRISFFSGSASDLGLSSANTRDNPTGNPLIAPAVLQTSFPSQVVTLEINRIIIKRRYIDCKLILVEGESEMELYDISTFWGADEKSVHIVEFFHLIRITGRTDASGNLLIGRNYFWISDPSKLTEAYIEGELQGRILINET